jgi:nucleoside-diphosphate-sugar epimerase
LERAVVLGGTGFLGRALCTELHRLGFDVEPMGSRALDLGAPDAASHLRELTAGATLVLASAVAPPRGQTVDGLDANLAIVTSVVRALDAGVSRCVYVSSDAVYDWSSDPLTEVSPVAPDGLYGIAKYAGERLLASACAGTGVPLLVLRTTGVFGPDDPHGAYGPNRFVRQSLAEGAVTLFGAGEEERDHLWIDDFAALAGALVTRGAEGVLNLATGTSRSFASIVQELDSLLPFALRIEHAARTRPVTHRRFDVRRLRAAVPEHRPTPFREALAAMLSRG